MVGDWLLTGFRPRLFILWWNTIRISTGGDCRAQHRLLLLGFAQRLCHLSAHVRDHHAGAHHRISGGAHEIFRGHGHCRALDVSRLFPVSSYGLGH